MCTTSKQSFQSFFTGLRAHESKYSDLFNLTLLLLWGIPLQAVIGGITVWQRLNPWMVTAHYLASAIMIGLAAILVNRMRRYFRADVSEREILLGNFPHKKVVLSAYLVGLVWR